MTRGCQAAIKDSKVTLLCRERRTSCVSAVFRDEEWRTTVGGEVGGERRWSGDERWRYALAGGLFAAKELTEKKG